MHDVIIRQIPAGPFGVFTYFVACPVKREAAIIDPAGEEERIANIVKEENAEVKYILNTHGHADHILANQTLKALVDAPTCMHEQDIDFFARQDIRKAASRELGLPPQPPADIRLAHGDMLELGNHRIEVIHTPGHTPGSVCFLISGNLFTGDTLFVGAVGRTDLTGSSFDFLLKSIEERLMVLPGDTIIWPGHNYGETPTSTMAREMRENPYITDFLI